MEICEQFLKFTVKNRRLTYWTILYSVCVPSCLCLYSSDRVEFQPIWVRSATVYGAAVHRNWFLPYRVTSRPEAAAAADADSAVVAEPVSTHHRMIALAERILAGRPSGLFAHAALDR